MAFPPFSTSHFSFLHNSITPYPPQPSHCGGCNQTSPSLVVHRSHSDTMAASFAVALALPIPTIGQKKAFFNPMKLVAGRAARLSPRANARFRVFASSSAKEKVVTGLTALALTAAMVIPDVAEAAQPGISPSLKNFLLSILAGGVVLVVLVGAVIGVANFDPVKRS